MNGRKFAVCCIFAWLPIAAQAEALPQWGDASFREQHFSQRQYLVGFAEDAVGKEEAPADALKRVKADALRELAQSLTVQVSSTQTLQARSVNTTSAGEQIMQLFTDETTLNTHLSLANIQLKSYCDKRHKTAYAFAYVNRNDLAAYYATLLGQTFTQLEATLNLAAQSERKGAKLDALRHCRAAMADLDKAQAMLRILSALGSQGTDVEAQAAKWASLSTAAAPMWERLRQSITVYVASDEAIFGTPSDLISAKVKATLSQRGYVLAGSEGGADYVVRITASATQTGESFGLFFCKAAVAITMVDARTGSTHCSAHLTSKKQGNASRESAGREAMGSIADGTAKELEKCFDNGI